MTPEQDNFEELRRLLAFKRHEQPRPGYFQHFSRQVIARIQAGEVASDSFLERWLTRAPWLQALWSGFEAKPILAGAFGVGVCSLLVVGLVSSERVDSDTIALVPHSGLTPATVATVPLQNAGWFERSAVDHSMTGSVYTAQSRSSIFDEIRPRVQTVNFSVPVPVN